MCKVKGRSAPPDVTTWRCTVAVTALALNSATYSWFPDEVPPSGKYHCRDGAGSAMAALAPLLPGPLTMPSTTIGTLLLRSRLDAPESATSSHSTFRRVSPGSIRCETKTDPLLRYDRIVTAAAATPGLNRRAPSWKPCPTYPSARY